MAAHQVLIGRKAASEPWAQSRGRFGDDFIDDFDFASWLNGLLDRQGRSWRAYERGA